MPDKPMKRREIAKVLGRHPGSKTEVSRRAKVSNQAVSMWLKFGSNANVAAVAEKHARELLEAERLAAGYANGPSVRAVLGQLKPKASEEQK